MKKKAAGGQRTCRSGGLCHSCCGVKCGRTIEEKEIDWQEVKDFFLFDEGRVV